MKSNHLTADIKENGNLSPYGKGWSGTAIFLVIISEN